MFSADARTMLMPCEVCALALRSKATEQSYYIYENLLSRLQYNICILH